MKSKWLLLFFLSTCLFSCGVFNSLRSTTTIDPIKDFVLGNNQHNGFKVSLRNDAPYAIQYYLAPITGGKHSGASIASKATVKIKVDKNTALVIQNTGNDTVNVGLKVTGDIGLSMDYE